MTIRDGFRVLFTGSRELCEACGGEFTCGPAVTGCWCSKVSVSQEVRDELKQKYKRCLCPECLEKAAATGGELNRPQG